MAAGMQTPGRLAPGLRGPSQWEPLPPILSQREASFVARYPPSTRLWHLSCVLLPTLSLPPLPVFALTQSPHRS